MAASENHVRWVPQDYAASSSGQSVWAHDLLSRLSLRGDEVVLDVGCGNGQITAELATHVPGGRVIGMDASLEMINFARESFPPQQFPNPTFIHLDAQAISTDVEMHSIAPCDIAFSNAALHWMHDQPAVLRGLHRILKPGGQLILSAGGHGNAAGMIDVIDEVMSRARWQDSFRSFRFPWQFSTADEFRGWLNAAGFVPRRVELVPKQMKHDRVSLTSWLRTTWMPYWHCVPLDQADLFLREVVDAYAKRFPPNSGDELMVGMVRLEVEATSSR